MTSQPSATANPPEPRIVRRETIATGKKYDYVRLHVHYPSGKTAAREMVRHPGAVVIVPALPDGRIVMMKIFRLAVNDWVWECCAGTIERPRLADETFGPGEDPALCASRELVEETGYKPAKLTPLATFHTTPGLTDERMHAFFASDLTFVGQKLEEDEFIQVKLVEPADVWRMIDQGQIADGKTLAALLLAARRGFIRPA